MSQDDEVCICTALQKYAQWYYCIYLVDIPDPVQITLEWVLKNAACV